MCVCVCVHVYLCVRFRDWRCCCFFCCCCCRPLHQLSHALLWSRREERREKRKKRKRRRRKREGADTWVEGHFHTTSPHHLFWHGHCLGIWCRGNRQIQGKEGGGVVNEEADGEAFLSSLPCRDDLNSMPARDAVTEQPLLDFLHPNRSKTRCYVLLLRVVWMWGECLSVVFPKQKP